MPIGQKRFRFVLARPSQTGENARELRRYRIRFEKSLMATLALISLLLILFQKMPQKIRPQHMGGVGPITSLDLMPITRQGGVPRPPRLPQIPIPTEDEFLPADETIDSTRLSLDDSMFEGDGFPAFSQGPLGTTPRPIKEVIPEYPESERSKGVQGIVELELLVNLQGRVEDVRVLSNSTSSQVLLDAAIKAAYQTQYMPARQGDLAVSRWIRRPYRFQGN